MAYTPHKRHSKEANPTPTPAPPPSFRSPRKVNSKQRPTHGGGVKVLYSKESNSRRFVIPFSDPDGGDDQNELSGSSRMKEFVVDSTELNNGKNYMIVDCVGGGGKRGVLISDKMSERDLTEPRSFGDLLEEITHAPTEGLKNSTLKQILSVSKQCKVDMADLEEKLSANEESNATLLKKIESLENEIKKHQSDMLHEKKTFIKLFNEGSEVRNRLTEVVSENKRKTDEISTLKEVIEILELKANDWTKSQDKIPQSDDKTDERYQSLVDENQRMVKELEMMQILNKRNEKLVSENVRSKKKIFGLKKMVDDFKAKDRLYSMEVKDAIPLKSIAGSANNLEKSGRRERRRPNKQKTEGREGNTIGTRREYIDTLPNIKEKPSWQVILNRRASDEKRKMTDPRLSELWYRFDEEVKEKLICLYDTCERCTQIWHSNDEVGAVMLTTVSLDDLYSGAWISTDLVDWFFCWYLVNLRNKHPNMSESHLTETCSLRSGCYIQWKSDDTGENGLQMINDDIDRKLKASIVNLLVPLMLTPNHWALLFLDMSSFQWSLYNSIPGRDEDLADLDSFRRHLQKILLPRIRRLRSDPSIVFKRQILTWEGPIQPNGNDCGMYICKFAETFIMGAPDYWLQEDIDNLRVEFVTRILMTE